MAAKKTKKHKKLQKTEPEKRNLKTTVLKLLISSRQKKTDIHAEREVLDRNRRQLGVYAHGGTVQA